MGGANAAFANRGAMSRGGMGRPGGFGGGGGMRGGGGGMRGGGGGARRGGGGGRRSDVRLKHDIVLLGRLDDGTVKANKYRQFSASNLADRSGDS
jgi:hypothetical protein